MSSEHRSINLPYGGDHATVNWCIPVMDGDDTWPVDRLRSALTEAMRRIVADGFAETAIAVMVGTADYKYQSPPLEMIARRNCTPEEAQAERERVGSAERQRLEQQIAQAQATLDRLEREKTKVAKAEERERTAPRCGSRPVLTADGTRMLPTPLSDAFSCDKAQGHSGQCEAHGVDGSLLGFWWTP